jgi:hypothetical protein
LAFFNQGLVAMSEEKIDLESSWDTDEAENNRSPWKELSQKSLPAKELSKVLWNFLHNGSFKKFSHQEAYEAANKLLQSKGANLTSAMLAIVYMSLALNTLPRDELSINFANQASWQQSWYQVLPKLLFELIQTDSGSNTKTSVADFTPFTKLLTKIMVPAVQIEKQREEFFLLTSDLLLNLTKQTNAWSDVLQHLNETIAAWKLKYPAQLAEFREAIIAEFPHVSSENIGTLQKKMTAEYQKFVQGMLNDAMELLGEPSFTYAWVGLGSYSRQEMLPYSDIEYLWFYDSSNEQAHIYCSALNYILKQQAICAGEVKTGFHFDVDPGEQDLSFRGLPEEVAHAVVNKAKAPKVLQGLGQEILSYLNPRLIAGDAHLLERYQQALEEKLNERGADFSGSCRHTIGAQFLVGDFGLLPWFRRECQGSRAAQNFNIKTAYAAFLTYLLPMIKLITDHTGQNTIALSQHFLEVSWLKLCAPKMQEAWQKFANAWAEVQVIRYHTQCYFKGAEQKVSNISSKAAYTLSHKEKKTLKKIYNTVLTPIYAHLEVLTQIFKATKPSKRGLLERYQILSTIEIASWKSMEPTLVDVGKMSSRGTVQSLFNYSLRQQATAESTLELLITLGANATESDYLGVPPCWQITDWAHEDPNKAYRIWTWLSEVGASLDVEHPQKKQSLLDWAMQRNEQLLVKTLIQLGAGHTAQLSIIQSFFKMMPRGQTWDNLLLKLQQQNAELAWCAALDALWVADEKIGDAAKQLEGESTRPGYLALPVSQQLFAQGGEFNKANEEFYGRRYVAKVKVGGHSVFAKFYPELPGMEAAVSSLALQLFSYGTARSELFRLTELTQKKVYPLLFSHHVPGENFHDVLIAAYEQKREDAKKKLQQLDVQRFSQLFLLHILIHAEDGKPDNYILSPLIVAGKTYYQLVGVDNDHALVEPVLRREDETLELHAKTILYTLDDMLRPLHPDVIEAFIKKEPEAELNTWLSGLIKKQKRYEELFELPERQVFLEKECVTQIPFPQGSVPKLYERWERLRRTLQKNPKSSALDILCAVEPLLGKLYRIELENAEKNPLARFQAVCGSAYNKKMLFGERPTLETMTTTRHLLKTQNIPEKVLLENQSRYSPAETKNELTAALVEISKLFDVRTRLSKGDLSAWHGLLLTSNKELLLKKFDWRCLSSAQQKKLLNACKGLTEYTFNYCRELNITRFKQLTAGYAPRTLVLQGTYENFLTVVGSQRYFFLSDIIDKRLESLTLQDAPGLLGIFSLDDYLAKLRSRYGAHRGIIIKDRLEMGGMMLLGGKGDFASDILGEEEANNFLSLPPQEKGEVLVKQKTEVRETQQERDDILENFNRYVNMDDFDPITISRLVPYVDSPNLKVILLQDCPSLKKFFIRAPQLKELSFNKLPNLSQVHLENASVLEKVNFINCPQLTFEKLLPFLQNAPKLTWDQCLIHHCPKIEKKALLQWFLRRGQVTPKLLEALGKEKKDGVLDLREVSLSHLDLRQLQTQLTDNAEQSIVFSTIAKVDTRQWTALANWIYHQPKIKIFLETINYLLDKITSLEKIDLVGIRCVAFLSSNFLLCSSMDGKLIVLNIKRQQVILVEKGIYASQFVCFSEDEFISLSRQGELLLWNLKKDEKKQKIDFQQGDISSILGFQGSEIEPDLFVMVFQKKSMTLIKVGWDAPSEVVSKYPEYPDNTIGRAISAKYLFLEQSTKVERVKLFSYDRGHSRTINLPPPHKVTALVSLVNGSIVIGTSEGGVFLDDGITTHTLVGSATDAIVGLCMLQQNTLVAIDVTGFLQTWEIHTHEHQGSYSLAIKGIKNLFSVNPHTLFVQGESDFFQLKKECQTLDVQKDWQNLPPLTLRVFGLVIDFGTVEMKLLKPLFMSLCLKPSPLESQPGHWRFKSTEEVHQLLIALLATRRTTLAELSFDSLPAVYLLSLLRFNPRLPAYIHVKKDEATEYKISFQTLAQLTQPIERISKPNLHRTLWVLSSPYYAAVCERLLRTLRTLVLACTDLPKDRVSLDINQGHFLVTSKNTIVLTGVENLIQGCINFAGVAEKYPLPVSYINSTPRRGSVTSDTIIAVPPSALSLGSSMRLITPRQPKKTNESSASVLPLFSIFTQLPNPFVYRTHFKQQYTEPLWQFIIDDELHPGDSLTSSAKNAVIPFLQSKNKMDQTLFLEALEWIRLKLMQTEARITLCKNRIALSEPFFKLGKKSKDWYAISQVLPNYHTHLLKQLPDCIEQLERQSLQKNADLCVIFLAGERESRLQGKKWVKKNFFPSLATKNLTLFDRNLGCLAGFKTLSLKNLWKFLYEQIEESLPLEDLKAELASQLEIYKPRQQRYRALVAVCKSTISSLNKSRPWKPQWLFGKDFPVLRCGGRRGVEINAGFHLSHSWENKRLQSFTQDTSVAAVLGSTYFGQNKPLDKETTLCMDANYQLGRAGATVDGYGYFQDPNLNRTIQQAAYRAAKVAARYALVYPDADSLYKELPKLFMHLGQVVKYGDLHPENVGGCSCVLSCVFEHPHIPNQVTVVAAGIGDSLVAAWDPVNPDLLQILISPRQYERWGQYSPLALTEESIEPHILRAKITGSQEMIICRMTDGAWQGLPHRRNPRKTEHKKTYLDYTFDDVKICQALKALQQDYPQPNAEEYRLCLTRFLQDRLADQKAYLIESRKLIQHFITIFREKKANSSQTVNDFLDYLQWENADLYLRLLTVLNIQDIDVSSMQPILLETLESLFEQLQTGDDFCLHVMIAGQLLQKENLKVNETNEQFFLT